MSLTTTDTRSLKKPMASSNEPHSRRLALSSLALASILLTIISTILTIVNAASLFKTPLSFRALAIISVILNVAAVAALVSFLIQVVWKQDQRWHTSSKSRTLLLSLYSSPLFLTSLFTVITYGLTQSHLDVVQAEDSGASNDLMAAKFAVWALSTLTQVIFLAAATRWIPLSEGTVCKGGSPYESMGQEMRQQSPAMSIRIGDDKPVSKPLSSPTFSTDSLQSSRNSWRSSLQQAVRPITSRTRLLSKAASFRESGSFRSGNTTRTNSITQGDGFETWDTSSVDQQIRDTVMQSTGPGQDLGKSFGLGRGTRLDPIPGSRPVSPARALDGPFPLEPIVSLEDLRAPTPAFMCESPQVSRPTTPVDVDDANVHPLFRSDSPHPPPAASPGTVVVASPFSGQVIQRPPTIRSVRSRADSRTRGQTPIFDEQSIRSNASMRSLRSPSPPAREITPPVPEFILGDSPRMSSGSLRKVSLHKEDDR